MDKDLDSLIRSVLDRIKAGDFGVAFFADVASLVVYLLDLLSSERPTFGLTSEQSDKTVGLMVELESELTGQAPRMAGPLSKFAVSILLRALTAKALELINSSDLPEPIKQLLRQFLHSAAESAQ